jgi:ABC-2 type transport system ATP-binding protein
VKILTTLTQPTSGSAGVEGFNVLTHGTQVRSLIGVVPQENNLDRLLTAEENLILHAKMHRLTPGVYRGRIEKLLKLTELYARRDDFPDKFSGGMQRRLVVARALVHEPRVIFLDEPTTGLDPQARRAVWEYIRSIRGSTTVLLTTHYMEEADQLCDRIIIMDHGKALVDGAGLELKRLMDDAHAYEIALRDGAAAYTAALDQLDLVKSWRQDGGNVEVRLQKGVTIKALLDHFRAEDVLRVHSKEPTLEDVFIALTGREIRE